MRSNLIAILLELSLNTVICLEANWTFGCLDETKVIGEWFSELECMQTCLQHQHKVAQLQELQCHCADNVATVQCQDLDSKYVVFKDIPMNVSLITGDLSTVDVAKNMLLKFQFRFPAGSRNKIQYFCTESPESSNHSKQCLIPVKKSDMRQVMKSPYYTKPYAFNDVIVTTADEIINLFSVSVKILDNEVQNNTKMYFVMSIKITPSVSERVVFPFTILRPPPRCQVKLSSYILESNIISVKVKPKSFCNFDIPNVTVHIVLSKNTQTLTKFKSSTLQRSSVEIRKESISYHFEKIYMETMINFTTEMIPKDVRNNQNPYPLVVLIHVFLGGIRDYLEQNNVMVFQDWSVKERDSIIYPSAQPSRSFVSSLETGKARIYCNKNSKRHPCFMVSKQNGIVQALPRALTLVLAIDISTNEIYGERNRGGKGVYDPNTKRFYSIPTSQWEKVKDGLIHAKIFTREELHAKQTPSFTVNGVAHQCCNDNESCACDVTYCGVLNRVGSSPKYLALWGTKGNCVEEAT